MVMSIVSTLRTLLWSLVTVLLLMSGVGSYLAWVVGDYLAADGKLDSAVVEYFGSIPRIMTSLFQATTGGIDWRELTDLLCRVSPIACAIFYAYISMMVFAIMNILTGICVNHANKAADDDTDLCTEDMLKNDVNVVTLRKILVAGRRDIASDSSPDQATSSKLNWANLKTHLNNPKVRSYFNKIGLEPWHLRSFFDLLKVGEEEPEVEVDQFIRGCVRLRCNVKNIDLMSALHENKEYESRRIKDIMSSMQEVRFLVSQLDRKQHLRSAAHMQILSADGQAGDQLGI